MRKIETVATAISNRLTLIGADERMIKIGVLTGYLGAREGQTEGQILEMVIKLFNERGISPDKASDIVPKIKAGASLYREMPNLSSEEVYKLAIKQLGKTSLDRSLKATLIA